MTLCALQNWRALGFRVQGLGLNGCREKYENGRDKTKIVH